MEKPALPFHERLFALVVAGFFLFLVFMNYWLSEKEIVVDERQIFRPQEALIDVVVEGKVRHPGTYRVQKGTAVAEVIEKAEPLEGANLGKLKLEGKITRRRKIKIR